ncbi:MAG TPA: hypothetical protein VF040_14270 [Ktedonobacterales bacterium]
MEKKTRSPRRAAAPAGNKPVGTRARRPRTLADATDPRIPTQGYDDFEPEYSAREAQAPSGTPHFTLPSVPAMPAVSREGAKRRSSRTVFDRIAHPRRHQEDQEYQESPWEEYARQGEEWDEYPNDDDVTPTGRSRAHSVARPLSLALAPVPVQEPAAQERYQSGVHALVATDSVPDLSAWRPPVPPMRKPVYTRAIETARRNPWSVSRTCLAIIALVVTLVLSVTHVGEASQPLMAFYNAQAAGANGNNVANLVKPLTQGKRVDQYDSVAQYNAYWGAACSAAVLAEVLTAWGERNVTIGSMIDELGSYISPNGGLLSYAGFEKVAAKHGFRSDFRQGLSYKQMLYITNTLHLPLIVNVRISYGYYHFFSGGHFLVMTAGDNQGVRLVDSSLYYVNYMPLSVFYSMFTKRTVLLVPEGYTYTLPSP